MEDLGFSLRCSVARRLERPYTPAVVVCHVCGAEVDPGSARFCHACGEPLRTAAVSVEAREERRVVTILFCDLVDSTSRFDLADPEDVRATLASYLGRVQREIERFGGTVEKFIGDAVMAVYGVPTVHEDDAQRAIFSALRILPVMEAMNEGHPELPLAVRIGVETGEAIVDLGAEPSRQGIVFGDVVNTASRLQTVAPTGGILVGAATHRLTREVFEYQGIEPVTVKGKAEPLRVWLATAARSRFGAELQPPSSTLWVDRDDELELLKRTFARSVREPSVQLVTLIGEPGVGKSRLVKEFFAFVDDRPQTVFWRQGRCLPYGEGVTFWALGEVVKAQAGILESDGALDAGKKLASTTSALVSDPAEREWIRTRLAPLIGLADAQAESIDRAETFSAWRRFLEAMASIRPLVLVLEDMHWADISMLAFVEHVMEWATDLPIFIICTARPELFDRDPAWGGGKRNWSTLSLPPLGEADAGELVAALLPPEAPDALQHLVIERAGGNPLFAEEFVRMLGEQLAADAEGSRAELPGDHTPASLHAIIAARLDTLAPLQKTLLQDASVVGRVFWTGALTSMGRSDRGAVDNGLHELARKELVRPSKVSSVKEEAEFSFWHTLIRDVAYGQIPRARRVPKHIAVAEWIERMAGERVSEHAELLAHHYDEALKLLGSTGFVGEVAALQATTRRYWVLAGERAMNLDVARAAECFERALELLPETHPDRASILIRRAAAAFDAGRFRDAQRVYEAALVLSREAQDHLSEGACLDHLATVLWEQGDSAGARVRLAQAVEVLEAQPHGPELADCYTSLASDRMVSGRFEEALTWAERSLALSSELGAEHLRPRALSFRGVARCYRGDFGGLDDLHAAIGIAERMGLAREQAKVLVILAEVVWATDGPSRAIEAVDAASELATRRGLGDIVVACRTQSLGPLFDLGRWDDLVSIADEVVEWSEAAGSGYDEITAQLWKAQVLIWRGERPQETSIADFMIPAREIADPQVLVPAVVVSGLIALDEGRPDEAMRLVEDLDQTPDVGLGWYREHFIVDLVRLCVAAGDVTIASRLLERAEAVTARHRLSLESARATLQEALGATEEASVIYQEAASGWSAYGHVVETGPPLLGAGRGLAHVNRRNARSQLLRAREIFTDLGASVLRAEVDACLSEEPG
jgi:class 3 adenylate cyclase/tetratricopeptide (TPR) repeat protein